MRGTASDSMERGSQAGRTCWWNLLGIIAVGTGTVLVGAAVSAAATAARQHWLDASYYRLIVDELWQRFDAWIVPGLLLAVLGAGVVQIWWRRSGHGCNERAAAAAHRRIVLACLCLVAGLRIATLVDAARVASGPNLLVISIDTLRADRLGAYGCELPTTPAIDRRLAAEGVTFESCYSQSPKTTPSHMTMLTSLYPCVHGIPLWEGTAPGPVLNPAVHTLAEVLKNAGYATAAFTGGAHMDGSRGFDQGFDVYRPGGQSKRARRWLTRHRKSKFFVLFHTYAVHDPYLPPHDLVEKFAPGYRGPIRETVARLRKRPAEWRRAHDIFWDSVDRLDPREVEFVRRLYDASIRRMDGSIVAPLLRHLDEIGVASNTLVVFTSDHGEAFGEHGAFMHGDLYAETLRVPLILRFPGRLPAGRRVTARVRLIDVMPTMLDLLGVTPPPALQGQSLVPLMMGEERTASADVISEHSDKRAGRFLESLRHGGLTYILDGQREELFDTVTDSGEQANIEARKPEAVAAMRAVLARWRRSCKELGSRFGPRGGMVAPAERTVRQLRALGYVE